MCKLVSQHSCWKTEADKTHIHWHWSWTPPAFIVLQQRYSRLLFSSPWSSPFPAMKKIQRWRLPWWKVEAPPQTAFSQFQSVLGALQTNPALICYIILRSLKCTPSVLKYIYFSSGRTGPLFWGGLSISFALFGLDCSFSSFQPGCWCLPSSCSWRAGTGCPGPRKHEKSCFLSKPFLNVNKPQALLDLLVFPRPSMALEMCSHTFFATCFKMWLKNFQTPFQLLPGLSTAEVRGMCLLHTQNIRQATDYTTYTCGIHSKNALENQGDHC